MMANYSPAQQRRRQVEIEGYVNAGVPVPAHLQAGYPVPEASEKRPPPSSQPDEQVAKKARRARKEKKGKKKKKAKDTHSPKVQHGVDQKTKPPIPSHKTTAKSHKDDAISYSHEDGSRDEQGGPVQEFQRWVDEEYGGDSSSNDSSTSSSSGGDEGGPANNAVPPQVRSDILSKKPSLRDMVGDGSKISRVVTDPNLIPTHHVGGIGKARTHRVLFPRNPRDGSSHKTPQSKIKKKRQLEDSPDLPSSEVLNSKALHSMSKRSGSREIASNNTPTKSLPRPELSQSATHNSQKPFGNLVLLQNEAGEFEQTMLKHLKSSALRGPPAFGTREARVREGNSRDTAIPINFGMTLERNGISGLTGAAAAANASDITLALLEPRHSDVAATKGEFEAYVKAVLSAPNNATLKMHFANHLLDLSSTICATVFGVKLRGYVKNGGKLSAGLPDPVPGMLQGILPADFESYVGENVRRAVGPAAAPGDGITLAHVVGDWKEKDSEPSGILELRHMYHGAILVEGHESATRCSGVDQQSEPCVLGFTTDGQVLNMYAHFSVLVEDDETDDFKKEYCAFKLKSVRITQSLAEFSMGRNMVRNLQKWGGHRSQNLRELLAGVSASHMLQTAVDAGGGGGAQEEADQDRGFQEKRETVRGQKRRREHEASMQGSGIKRSKRVSSGSPRSSAAFARGG
ncbi:hypothetical protein MKZ38_003325 [Zalerion maritima]|uniref:Uncharacterized protein n=1 Tax=Zalerion maritima TaxID=339359 RepID=A0AAD5RP59_9PEZI|nr:hypothetical protein MKZ38_003325 [Zalerion maritima]